MVNEYERCVLWDRECLGDRRMRFDDELADGVGRINSMIELFGSCKCDVADIGISDLLLYQGIRRIGEGVANILCTAFVPGFGFDAEFG